MKKIVLILLCFVFLFSGCNRLQKAEPYYTESHDSVTFDTQFDYYFNDESDIRCIWKNETDSDIYFHDTFELHILGSDGEWYLVTKGEEVNFHTDYCHFVEPNIESSNYYDISIYTDSLKSGETYRLSTYFFDDSENYYQVFAQFVCDNELAEIEMSKVTDGSVSHREDPEYGGSLQVIPGKTEDGE